MSGFTRRYASNPGQSVLGQIEGVVIIDGEPVLSVTGLGTGTVALVGEFADMTYAVAVDASGNVTTKYQPVEIFGGPDLTDKVGGLDITLGDFGLSQGNGWMELANKRFTRLVLVPINLASSKGVRLWRHLPTNRSATDPSPAQPIQGGVVSAGREFRSSTNRVHVAATVRFTADAAFHTGTDGATTNAAAAASNNFTGTGFDTVVRADGTVGVQAGDILVVGVVGGAGALGANAGTYRVVSRTSGTVIVVERMDGTNFAWTTGTLQPYRVHIPDTADSGGGFALSANGAYDIPARPLDATISTSVNLVPLLVPAAIAADSSDPLSGLAMRTQSVTGLVYTAALQAPNVASSATVDAEYQAAIDSLLSDGLPAREVNIVWAARKSATIRSKLKTHALQQKANGIGRVCLISPEINVVAAATFFGDASPGVGAQRAEEVIYCAPGVQTSIPAAVGQAIEGADGLVYTDGIIDQTSDGWAASILSNLAPHRNIGQAADPVKTVMAPVLGMQRGIVPAVFDIGWYTQAKAKGICAPRMDRAAGAIFQSDVTTSITSGQRLIRRRRMSFMIQDDLAALLLPFAKEVLTTKFQNDVIGAHAIYFETLLSRNNPAAAQILDYRLDVKSGNTPTSLAAGIFVVIHRVEMLPTADVIVLQSSVGYNVLTIAELTAA